MLDEGGAHPKQRPCPRAALHRTRGSFFLLPALMPASSAVPSASLSRLRATAPARFVALAPACGAWCALGAASPSMAAGGAATRGCRMEWGVCAAAPRRTARDSSPAARSQAHAGRCAWWRCYRRRRERAGRHPLPPSHARLAHCRRHLRCAGAGPHTSACARDPLAAITAAVAISVHASPQARRLIEWVLVVITVLTFLTFILLHVRYVGCVRVTAAAPPPAAQLAASRHTPRAASPTTAWRIGLLMSWERAVAWMPFISCGCAW